MVQHIHGTDDPWSPVSSVGSRSRRPCGYGQATAETGPWQRGDCRFAGRCGEDYVIRLATRYARRANPWSAKHRALMPLMDLAFPPAATGLRHRERIKVIGMGGCAGYERVPIPELSPVSIAEISLLSALLAGALSFLSPCVLPLVPPYLCTWPAFPWSSSGGRRGHRHPLNEVLCFSRLSSLRLAFPPYSSPLVRVQPASACCYASIWIFCRESAA